MKAETQLFIDRILSEDWISASASRRVPSIERVIDDWDAATSLFICDNYSDMKNAMSNELRNAALPVIWAEKKTEEQKDQWELFVSEWRERCREPFCLKAEATFVKIGTTPDDLSGYVASSIFKGCLESEFSEYAPHHFFRDWCDWLVNGYFACYWDGDIEGGQFVLFDLVRAANSPMKLRAMPKVEEPWDPDSPVKREAFWAQLKLENVKDRKIALAGFVHDMLSVDWFRGVGKPLTNPPGDTRLFCNWDEAFMSFFDKAFTAARSDYAKRLEAAVMAVPALAKAWDELSSLWEQDYSATTRQKIRKSVPMASHTQEINAALHEPLKFGALEVAFADVAPNRFFRDWNYWIWRGYFPAEWFGGPPPESFARLLPPEVRNQEAPIEFGVL